MTIWLLSNHSCWVTISTDILYKYIYCNVLKGNTINNESLEWLKFGELGSQTFWRIKVWRIYHKVNKRPCGLIVGWWMKVWRILSIHQIRQILATPNFRCLRYAIIMVLINIASLLVYTYVDNMLRQIFRLVNISVCTLGLILYSEICTWLPFG